MASAYQDYDIPVREQVDIIYKTEVEWSKVLFHVPRFRHRKHLQTPTQNSVFKWLV